MVMPLLTAAWSFLRSPAGLILAAAVAFSGWTLWQRSDAASEAVENCAAKSAQSQIAEVKRQLSAAQRSAETANIQRVESAKRLQRLEGERDEIVELVRGSGCDIPDPVRQRLQSIR